MLHVKDAVSPVNPATDGDSGVMRLALSATPMAVPLADAVLSLGAVGGTGNDGSVISVTDDVNYLTSGDYSNGIIAQSIGAGGGQTSISGLGAQTIILGGQDGAQGHGGAITLSNSGLVQTAGLSAHGILLQSIGGGGGMVFGADSIAEIILSDDNSGNGGLIMLNQTGDIRTTGDDAHGIFAQSLGGGGGIVGSIFAGTAGGNGAGAGAGVELTLDGHILAAGSGSAAVKAQSLGGLGGDNIIVMMTKDVRGGSGTGVGIALDGGKDNRVEVAGSLSAVSGMMMTGTSGNDRLQNNGFVVGNMMLGGGQNLVVNGPTATFMTIDQLNLREGLVSTGRFENQGLLLMGLSAPKVPIDLLAGETFFGPDLAEPITNLLYGTSQISQVALNGDFEQTATGRASFDVGFGPYDSDRIDVSGQAVVDWIVDINLTWLENVEPITLISAGAGGTNNGLDPTDTLALDYGIIAGPTGIQLTVDSDFGQDFLDDNKSELGHHFNSAIAVGGAAGIGRLLTLLGNLTAEERDIYADIFAELDPEALLLPAVYHLDSARAFGGEVMSCETDEKLGAACAFGSVAGHRFRRTGGTSDFRFDTSARIRMGLAVSLADGWRAGAALGLDDIGDIRANEGRFNGTNGSAFHVGVGIGKSFAEEKGEAQLSFAVGTQQFNSMRSQIIFEPLYGSTRLSNSYLGFTGAIRYQIQSGNFFATPMIEAQAMRLSVGNFAEKGLEGMGARSTGASDWYLSATPKLEVGFVNGSARLSGSVGYQFSNGDRIAAPMRLIGSPDASVPATIYSAIDENLFQWGLNADVTASDKVALQFGFESLHGEMIRSKTASAKLRVQF